MKKYLSLIKLSLKTSKFDSFLLKLTCNFIFIVATITIFIYISDFIKPLYTINSSPELLTFIESRARDESYDNYFFDEEYMRKNKITDVAYCTYNRLPFYATYVGPSNPWHDIKKVERPTIEIDNQIIDCDPNATSGDDYYYYYYYSGYSVYTYLPNHKKHLDSLKNLQETGSIVYGRDIEADTGEILVSTKFLEDYNLKPNDVLNKKINCYSKFKAYISENDYPDDFDYFIEIEKFYSVKEMKIVGIFYSKGEYFGATMTSCKFIYPYFSDMFHYKESEKDQDVFEIDDGYILCYKNRKNEYNNWITIYLQFENFDDFIKYNEITEKPGIARIAHTDISLGTINFHNRYQEILTIETYRFVFALILLILLFFIIHNATLHRNVKEANYNKLIYTLGLTPKDITKMRVYRLIYELFKSFFVSIIPSGIYCLLYSLYRRYRLKANYGYVFKIYGFSISEYLLTLAFIFIITLLYSILIPITSKTRVGVKND